MRLSPSSVRRIHATLRSALNDAVRRRVIPYNPAALAELEPTRRPKVRPWEPEELGAFLDFAADHRLGVLFEVLAMTGLRRPLPGSVTPVPMVRACLPRHRLVVSAA